MKKSILLKMKNLPATEEMLAVAREDVPVKVGSGWNTFYRCRYSGFVRSAVEGGILKVTLYDPDAMRLGGTLPVYEIFMEKEKQQFLTYDRTRNEWRTAKIDYLEWQAKGSNNVWISAGHRKCKRVIFAVQNATNRCRQIGERLMAEITALECDGFSRLCDEVRMLSVSVAAVFSALAINLVYRNLKLDLVRRPALETLRHV